MTTELFESISFLDMTSFDSTDLTLFASPTSMPFDSDLMVSSSFSLMDSESLIDLTMTTELFESIFFSDILITPTPSIDIIMCSPTPILEGILNNFI